ncbi:MAG: type II toxin-antitoxin system RelE/ParE family toxin [Acidobacteriaceae bacterium]|nr:type II toxin-antitoxin system RelE/ParE family toxin [Acidobacteriaceae bacterium]
MVRTVPITVLEMPEFVRASSKLMTPEERMDILSQIANDPMNGEVIPESGGLRKTRIAFSGRGKRSGGRVIYAYFGDDLPVFVFTCYAKNERVDLSQKDKQAFRKLLPMLVEEYRSSISKRIAKIRRGSYG